MATSKHQNFFLHFYHLLTAHSVAGGVWYLLVGVVVALVVILNPFGVWIKVRPFVTWLHEGGHALATLALSGKVRSITLRKDTSGLTLCSVPLRRGLFKNVRSALVALAGTPMPMVVGGAIALGLVYGYVHLVLGVLLAGIVLTLVQLRNWWGLLVVLIIGVLLAGAWALGAVVSEALLGVMAGVGLLGGLRSVFEGHRSRDARDGSADAEAAGAMLHIPVTWIEGVWVLSWVAVMVGVVVGICYR